MTLRQKFLQVIYPFWMWFNHFSSRGFSKKKNIKAPVDFYSLKATGNDGTLFEMSLAKGKKILIVNTASDCGYTRQLAGLEKLHQLYKNKLIVIGFPSNEFGQQEKGSDKEIASFCKEYFNVGFPLMKKGTVLKKTDQQEIYKWLTNKHLNGWNDKAPMWNFCKYVIDENGNLTHIFGPAVNPIGKRMKEALQ